MKAHIRHSVWLEQASKKPCPPTCKTNNIINHRTENECLMTEKIWLTNMWSINKRQTNQNYAVLSPEEGGGNKGKWPFCYVLCSQHHSSPRWTIQKFRLAALIICKMLMYCLFGLGNSLSSGGVHVHCLESSWIHAYFNLCMHVWIHQGHWLSTGVKLKQANHFLRIREENLFLNHGV